MVREFSLAFVWNGPTASITKSFRLIFKADDKGEGDITSFGALCTALAATVGTRNIIGVATAIASGGPGALFWMWGADFLGMATKYAERGLAIKYRQVDEDGSIAGGPMYHIVNGMGERDRPLGNLFAFSGILVSLVGIGMFTQVNTISSSIENTLHIRAELTGIVLVVLVGVIIFKGITAISKVAEKVVPIMAGTYILICLILLMVNFLSVLPAFQAIFKGAFSPSAAISGFSGVTVSMAIGHGIARGVFSNESGLGSAPIAAATSKTNRPDEQG